MNGGTAMNIQAPVRQTLFDPLDFFEGDVAASGMVVDWRGQVTRSFTALFSGHRAGPDEIAIFEQLSYSDGASEHRRWTISHAGEGLWQGTASGLATPVLIRRLADTPAQSRWTYDMDIPIGGREMRFAFEDIMIQVSEREMIALTPMRKLGITLARISSSYRRL
jgi:hypothetical protein